VRRVAGVVALLGALAACGHQPSPAPVPRVVSEPATAWEHITITAGAKSAELARDLGRRVAPLLASRDLPRPEALTAYGLDSPQATLSYRMAGGRVVGVLIGALNFDRHFVYIRRADGPTIYLVPVDSLRPVLALVGIEPPPPD
jgi:hypothetical protein